MFGIAAELIGGEVELLRALLRLHYGKLQIPLMLAERLIQVLKGHDGFKAWPLSEIVPDDEAPLCQDSCHLRSKQRLAPRPPAGGLGAAPVIFAAKVFFP